MSIDGDLSKHGSNYEFFMHRAYGTHKPSKPEMQASVMHNLIMAEKTSAIFEDLVPRFEGQLTLIKLYIGKAIDQYMEGPKITKGIADTLADYKTDLRWAINSDEIMRIVYSIIHICNRNKIMSYLI